MYVKLTWTQCKDLMKVIYPLGRQISTRCGTELGHVDRSCWKHRPQSCLLFDLLVRQENFNIRLISLKLCKMQLLKKAVLIRYFDIFLAVVQMEINS
jgi:hypothetical protein